MQWVRGSLAALAAVTAGCDQVTAPAPAPAPALAASPAAPVPALESYSGRSYAEFVAAHPDRFTPEALGLAPDDVPRLQAVMVSSAGALLEGGGVEALVFRGCAASGCGEGLGVVAIDGATGAAFVGVVDGAGRDVLAPNERLEALLRLNTPNRDWAGAGRDQPASQPPAGDAARP